MVIVGSVQVPAVDLALGTAAARLLLPFTPAEAGLEPLAESALAVSSDGTVIGFLEPASARRNATLDEVPPHVQQAVLATEDATFFRHAGVVPSSVQRALFRRLTGGSLRGVSTITQQLAKLNFTDGERTFRRKARELRYALALEENYTKEELFERYLNEVYFGDGALGIVAAAQEYFGVSPQRLSVAQAALLAGKIQSPNRLDPRRRPGAVKTRRDHVLRLMREQGWLTPEQLEAAVAAPLDVAARDPAGRATALHMLAQIRAELLTIPALGDDEASRARAIETGGYRIQTTYSIGLSEHIRRYGEAALRDVGVPSHNAMGAAAVKPGTGAVLALVSSPGVPGFNLATDGRRPPASLLDPIVYVAALRAGLARMVTTPDGGSAVVDCLGSPGLCPQGQTMVNLDEALARGDSAPFHRLRSWISPQLLQNVARDMGWASDPPRPCRPPTDPLDVVSSMGAASLFATIASGMRAEPYSVERVFDRAGREIYRHQAAAAPAIDGVVSEALAASLTLRGGLAGEAAAAGGAGVDTATPSGTDTWSARFTPQLSVATWVGNGYGTLPVTLDAAGGDEVAVPEELTRAASGITRAAIRAGTGPLPRADQGALVVAATRPDPVAPSAAASATGPTPSLVTRLADLLSSESTAGAMSVAVAVDGTGVAHINGDLPLPPASTQKLFTAGTALLELGPEHRLVTEIRATGPLVAGTLQGDVVLVASGDPTLGRRDLEALAGELRSAGVIRVSGGVSVDDTRHDRQRAGVGWTWQDLSWEVGPLSALVVDGNKWRCDEQFLRDPATGNGELFRDTLRSAGVDVARDTVELRGARSSWPVLARHASEPLSRLLGDMLRKSDNLAVEVLLKEIGRRAGDPTTAGGARVVGESVGDLAGPPAEHSTPVDGSGISRLNARSANEELAWLVALEDTAVFGEFKRSLTVACRTGTLRYRLCGTPAEGKLWAKTGTLRGGVALAGYVSAGGRRAAFSMILGEVRSILAARAAVDRAAVLITEALHEPAWWTDSVAAGATRAVVPPGPPSLAKTIPAAPVVPDVPQVAITFDDGPGPYTTQILDILAHFDAPATFFMVGEAAARSPEIVRAVVAAGHSVGHHSWSHPDLVEQDDAGLEEQIDRTTKVLEELSGTKIRCLRPPFASIDDRVGEALHERGLSPVGWSVDTRDWLRPPVESLVANTLEDVQPGSVILLHDGGGDRSRTVEALPQILSALRNRGYRFVPLCTGP